MVRLTKERKKTLLRAYKRREGRNYHRENAVILINIFGTAPQKKKAEKISINHLKRGGLTYTEVNWLYKYGHKHYDKILPKPRKVVKRRKKAPICTLDRNQMIARISSIRRGRR